MRQGEPPQIFQAEAFNGRPGRWNFHLMLSPSY